VHDYLIVGAGSAGCVLAARLSEDPAVNVLLLEAGGSDGKLEIRIPAAFSKLFDSEVDWGFRTAPQSVRSTAARFSSHAAASSVGRRRSTR